MRLLGDIFPRPRALAGTIVGNSAAPAVHRTAFLKSARRDTRGVWSVLEELIMFCSARKSLEIAFIVRLRAAKHLRLLWPAVQSSAKHIVRRVVKKDTDDLQ
jgi:hypothetical protein